ncbi:hypothetical protein ABB27_17300 [Stenotrophomonas terrae]|uniref:Uncharacterized protein n=1 Tax=Stenotrophomonas terrae TaxID=405446 RepID=A0A0R0CFF5_9GAMM|nr:hypothetical protein ABB27_17300 [Stenotrophomonas terrae]
MNELLALIRIWLTRKPLPRGANGIPPGLPANGKISQLPHTPVLLIRTTEADDGAMSTIIGGAAKKLPITIVVVTDQQNGITLA